MEVHTALGYLYFGLNKRAKICKTKIGVGFVTDVTKCFDYKIKLEKHRKLYQCYVEDQQSKCTTCGNNFQNKYLLANHNKKYPNL